MNNNSYSTLYKIEPIGFGTAYVESLTSYIYRLSREHCVSAGDILSDVITPVTGKAYLTNGFQRSCDPVYKNSYKINGMDQEARDFVSALQELTHVNSLEFLTLLPLNWLPAKGMIKPFQSWCPLCYEEWSSTKQPLYTPLIWSIIPVTFCNRHQVPLVNSCHKCNKKILYLSRNGRIGYCPNCGAWLGQEYNDVAYSAFFTYDQWASEKVALIIEKCKKAASRTVNL